jgi:hypothetical protein
MGEVVGTEEDSMVAEDCMVGTMAAIEVDTMEGSMVEVFTHIGGYGDGDFGDGLFWDGPMQVGPTCPMEDIRIWGGPTIPQKQLWRLQPIMNHSSKNNPITGITVRIRKDTTHTLKTVRVAG